MPKVRLGAGGCHPILMLMDRLVAFGACKEQDATPWIDGDTVAMLGMLIEHLADRAMAAHRDRRRKHLIGLFRMISAIVVLLIMAVRTVMALVARAAKTLCVVVHRAERHLHHPPQIWAAP